MVQEAIKFHPRNIKMIKVDQGSTRNSYKSMNVMKQDAIDDKIIEICKTCEKQCIQKGPNRSRSCRVTIGQKPTLMDREFVENLSARQKVSRWIEEAIEHLSRKNPETPMDRDYVNFCPEKKKERLDRRESIEDLSRSC